MPPSIYQTALSYKRDLAAREATIMRSMATRWLTVMNALDADMQDLARIVAARRAAGLPITAGYLYRNARYQALLLQANKQFEKFADSAVTTIAKSQKVYTRLGTASAVKMLELAEPGIAGGFERLTGGVAETVAGFLADNSPLKQLLEDAWPNSIQQTTDALTRGITLGYGPERVAKMMAQGMSTALNRAMVIARTETMRAYRTAKFEAWDAAPPGVIVGYQRVATHDARTCPACLFMDGQVFKNAADFAEHPQGRCTFIVVTKSSGITKWQYGPEWFEKQSPSVQSSMLGPGKYDAWKAGKFNLRDIPDVVDNPTWGKSLRVKTLAELTSGTLPPRVVVPPVEPETIARATYVPHATRDEAERWAFDNAISDKSRQFYNEDLADGLNPKKRVDYAGLDLDVANEVNRALHDAIARGVPKLSAIEASFSKESYLMAMNNSGEMLINTRVVKGLDSFVDVSRQKVRQQALEIISLTNRATATEKQKRFYDAAVETLKFTRFGVDDTPYGVVTHELGHHVDHNKFIIRGLDNFVTRADRDAKQAFADGFIQAIDKMDTPEYRYRLSEYPFTFSAQTDLNTRRKEIFAESFTAYMFGEHETIHPDLFAIIEELLH